MLDDSNINLAEELIPYIPPLVIRRLAKNTQRLSQAEAEIYSAAVLFVDIRGYSELAESFAEGEAEGSEELARFLNKYFDLLIRIITEHGGEVTKFAGDALLAIWPVPQDLARVGRAAREKLAQQVLSATQCARAIQKGSNELSRRDNSDSILRIGVAAGDVYAVHLGGILDRWEFLLSGEPMVQMSVAKDLGSSGDVVLSPEAWALVKDHCSGEYVGGRYAKINDVSKRSPDRNPASTQVQDDIVERMQSYVPAAITRRLKSGFGKWLSEIRYLTVLFVKLPGYGTSITHPYATTVPEAQAVMRAMQSSLYRLEGSINKFNVDDKGITLVAAMGIPPLSHRDDAKRAVQAALDMQRVLEALDRPCAIGVASGWVFCGPVGSDIRREYTVVGNSVNRAASLMQVAEELRLEANSPSYVLCDRETFEGITIGLGDFSIDGDQITFKRVSGVKLKGRRALVSAYNPQLRRMNLLLATDSSKKGPSLLGRLKELEIFTNHLRALTRSDTFLKVIVIEGEEGIGKSALLKEYLVDDAPRSVKVYEGRGEEFHQAESFHAWKPVFKDIFGIDAGVDDLGSQRRKVMRKLPILPGEKGFPALALRLTPLLNPVLDLEFAENRITKAMVPEVREQTTRLFLLRLLQQSFYDPRRRRQQPHMIILDNGQWLDDDSWRLAATVKNLVRPLMMVIAARPLHQDGLGWPLHPACSELLSERNLERISLSHLSKLQMADIYSEIAAPCTISAGLAHVLWRTAGGNPSLARQLIDHWRSEELICTDSEESSDISADGDIPLSTIPGTVQKNLVGRIDRLQPERQMIVKAASCFDGQFSEMELDQLLKRIGVVLTLSDHLPTLVDLQLVTVAEETQPRSYRLTSELLRDVTRNLLTKDQRASFQDADLMAS